MKKFIHILLTPLRIVKNLILWPFRWLKDKKDKAQEKRRKLSRLYILEENILLAKKYNLKLMISNNYDNELIISMSENEAKQATSRKI